MHVNLRLAPQLYTVSLAWPGAAAPQQDIAAVLSFVQTSIDLGLVYPGGSLLLAYARSHSRCFWECGLLTADCYPY